MRSIRSLFRSVSVVGGIIVFTLMTLLLVVQYQANLTGNMQKSLTWQAENEAQRLQRYVSDASRVAASNAQLAEILTYNEMSILHELLFRQVANNRFVRGAGIWWKPYSGDPALYYDSYYVEQQKDGKAIRVEVYNTPEYDYFSWDWWLKAQDMTGETVMTEPFYDPPSDSYMITISSPIHKDGQQTGICSVDFGLQPLNSYMGDIEVGDNGFVLLISTQGHFLADPRTNTIIPSISDTELNQLRQMANNRLSSESVITTLGDREYIVAMSPVATTDYSIIVAQPLDELFAARNRIIPRSILAFLFVLLLYLVVQDYLIKRKIVNPIAKAASIVEEISTGNFSDNSDTRFSAPQEIETLLDSVMHMRCEIEALLSELRLKNEHIEASHQHTRELYDQLQVGYEKARHMTQELETTHNSLLEVNNYLLESQDRLQMALWGAGAGLWDWNIPERWVILDDRYAEIMGYGNGNDGPLCSGIQCSEVQLKGNVTYLAKAMHPDDWAINRPILQDHFKGATPTLVAEYRTRHRDGHYIWVQNNGYVVERDDEGRAVRAVGIIQEITERKNVMEALRKSQGLYQSMFMATDNAVVVFRSDTLQIIEVNPMVEKMSGFTRHELLDCRFTDFSTLPDSESGPIMRNLMMSLREGRIESLYTQGVRKDKVAVPLLIRFNPIKTEEEPLVLAVMYDLSEELKRQEQASKMERYKAEAEKMTAISIMSAGIVHEISQPLNSLKLAAEGLLYLQEQGQPIRLEDALQSLRKISKEAERMKDIVLNLRSLVNAAEERSGYSGDLNQAVQNALKSLDQQFRSTGIQIRLDLDPRCRSVAGHPLGLEQIIVNLMTNAMQVLEKESNINPLIACRTRQKENTVLLEIADNGPGISPDIAAHIWEPFFSTRRGSEGMGLGLALVRVIVTRLGGTADCLTSSWGGANFVIELPNWENPSGLPINQSQPGSEEER